MEEGKIKDGVRLVAIGGSAGSLEVLMQLLPRLRADFAIPLVIVLHRKYSNDSLLIDLLSAKTPVKVKEIEEKEVVSDHTIYVVPADYHVLFEEDHSFSLDYSEKVNYSRPSIDIVFQSAADLFTSSLVCILLSGANADGTEGFKHVKAKGGVTIAQDPATAEVSFMPEQAILSNSADHIFNVSEIADFLNNLS